MALFKGCYLEIAFLKAVQLKCTTVVDV